LTLYISLSNGASSNGTPRQAQNSFRAIVSQYFSKPLADLFRVIVFTDALAAQALLPIGGKQAGFEP
jgi:hypothetical protein